MQLRTTVLGLTENCRYYCLGVDTCHYLTYACQTTWTKESRQKLPSSRILLRVDIVLSSPLLDNSDRHCDMNACLWFRASSNQVGFNTMICKLQWSWKLDISFAVFEQVDNEFQPTPIWDSAIFTASRPWITRKKVSWPSFENALNYRTQYSSWRSHSVQLPCLGAELPYRKEEWHWLKHLNDHCSGKWTERKNWKSLPMSSSHLVIHGHDLTIWKTVCVASPRITSHTIHTARRDGGGERSSTSFRASFGIDQRSTMYAPLQHRQGRTNMTRKMP